MLQKQINTPLALLGYSIPESAPRHQLACTDPMSNSLPYGWIERQDQAGDRPYYVSDNITRPSSRSHLR